MNPSHRSGGNLGFGFIVIVLGVLFLLDEFRILYFGDVASKWWPLILVFIGMVKFGGQERASGLIFIALGVAFLLANAGYFYWRDIFRLWPLLLILFGFSIAFGGSRRAGFRSRDVTENEFSVRSIFSGVERKMSSQNLAGGEIMVLFGGADVDLSRSTPAKNCHIRVSVIFGGAEIRVPEDWQVIITGTPILGGISDTTRQNDSGPVVKIYCSAIFGGIDLRN